MTRYYFDLVGGGWKPDVFGTEFGDLRSAENEAVRLAGEILRDEPDLLRQGPIRLYVHDERHESRFAVEAALVPVSPGGGQ